MAVAITATEQDVWPARVLVSVTGLTLGDEIQLQRVTGGVVTDLRGGYDASVGDTAFLAIDAELPFGVTVTHRAVVNGATTYDATPASYVLVGGKVALSDAVSGLSAEVTILAWPGRAYTRPGTVFQAGGRNIGVTGALGQFQASLELFTETTAASDGVQALLDGATEAIMQIRQPGGYDGVDSYVLVMAAECRRFSQDGTDQRRIWALTVAETDPWADELEALGYTLQDVADAYTGQTLADLAADYATLLDLAQAEF